MYIGGGSDTAGSAGGGVGKGSTSGGWARAAPTIPARSRAGHGDRVRWRDGPESVAERMADPGVKVAGGRSGIESRRSSPVGPTADTLTGEMPAALETCAG